MRWVGFAATAAIRERQLRSFSTERDYRRVAVLAKLWEKFNIRHDILTTPDQARVEISRTHRTVEGFVKLGLKQGCPRVIVWPPKPGKIEEMKHYIKGHMRNAFVRGVGLYDDKQEFLDDCSAVFFEVVRAIREDDFSSLREFTLGGNETLQFHRKAASQLTKAQKEALNITKDDYLGDNGYLMKYPYLRNEMGPYIHSLDFVSADAVGNALLDENKQPKVLCRYKVVFGTVYKFEMLRKEIQKDNFMWNQKIKTPKDYTFKWPRYVFVELDICQEATTRLGTAIKLDPARLLYDFHVFSF